MFPMTVTVHNHAQLQAVIAAMGTEPAETVSMTATQAAAAAAQEAAAAKKPTRTPAKTTEAAAPTQPTAEAGEGAAPESKDENSAQAQGNPPADETQEAVTYEQTAAAVTSLAKAKGRDAAIGVLKQFDAATLKDVAPEQFAAVVAACKAAGA